jgi:hypothetical protein
MYQEIISSNKQVFTIAAKTKHFAALQMKKSNEQIALAKIYIHYAYSNIKKELGEQVKKNGEFFIFFNDF